MRTQKTSLLALAMLAPLGAFSAGCDGQAQDTSAPTAGEQAIASTLATVDVGYGIVEFQQLTAPDGSFTLGMSEKAPGTFKSTPIDALLNGRRLTTLEVFRAIAPNHTVPSIIAESHPGEAQALGRGDASVLSVAFDRNAPVQKSTAACDSYVLEDTGKFADWTKVLKVNSTSGDKWLAVGNSVADWSFWTTARVTLGVCNDSAVNIQARISWDTQADASGWLYGGFATLNPGWMWRWFNFTNSTPDCRNVPPGGICVNQYAVRYGVNGVSAAGRIFHQRTAVEGPQKCTTSAQCPSFYACSGGICVPQPH